MPEEYMILVATKVSARTERVLVVVLPCAPGMLPVLRSLVKDAYACLEPENLVLQPRPSL
jgi:hypothetical protein